MGQAENSITKKIKDYLGSRQHWLVKYFANCYTKCGVPDILACVNGRFVGIEVKTDKNKMSKIQEYQAEKIKESGGYHFCVKPSNFEDFKKAIEEIENE